MKNLLIATALLISQYAFAQEETVKFKGESEASSVVVSGNSTSETYSAKTKNTYAISEPDLLTAFGSYLQSRAGGTENNKYWSAGLRYDRVIEKDLFNVFVQRKAEADPLNGYVQRDISELGGKYVFVKNEALTWFGEIGYQSQDTLVTAGVARETVGFARIYSEAQYQLNPSTKTKLWVEHLPNLKRSNESQSNAELSLSVAMNNIFSLKTAYLLNRNDAIAAPLTKDKTTWTTALVATY